MKATLFLFSIQRFQDNGMLNRLRHKYFITGNPADKTYDIVTLGGVAPILSVLAGGIILAFVILLFEKCHTFRKNNALKKRRADSRQIKMHRWFNFRGKKQSLQSKPHLPIVDRNGGLNSVLGYYP